jgi:hypothetical protein
MGYFKEKIQNLIKKKKEEEETRNLSIIIDTFHPFFSIHIKLRKFKTKILSFSIFLYLFVLTR